MKRNAFIILWMLILCTMLDAVPQPLHTIPSLKGKEGDFGADTYHIWGSNVFVVDNSTATVKIWNTAKIAYLPQTLIKLKSGASITDITGDETHLYLLDAKNSSIHVYNHDGSYVNEISTKGAPDIQFKEPVRIAVNYQGYLYILDKGRNELMAFTREGMLLGKVLINMPIAMTIGADQQLRVLLLKPEYYEVQVYDPKLNLKKSFQVQTIQDKKDEIADISINQFNELYVIYSGSTKIGKVNSEGRLISKSTWGSKDKGVSPSAFLEPAIVRAFPWENDVLLGVLDSKQRLVKLFKDTEMSSTNRLKVPEPTMRPSLEESDYPLMIDYLVSDSLEIFITSGTKNGASTRQLICRAFGKEKYVVTPSSYSTEELKGFDAIALYKDKLFVADSKMHKIIVLDKLTGALISSFGSKGNKEGRLNLPSGLATTSDGMLYISEKGNDRISVFNENAMFINSIDLSDAKLSPGQIRIKSNNLFVLTNSNSIYQIPIATPLKRTLLAQSEMINCFDIIYENRLGYIDGVTQQLVIMNGSKEELRYLSKSPQATFPNFAKIEFIAYNDWEKSLHICDTQAGKSRKLRFIYCPTKLESVVAKINTDKQVEFTWEVSEGISKWIVTRFGMGEPIKYLVSEPKYVVRDNPSFMAKYTVASLSLDNLTGVASAEIEDSYSFAKYLQHNGRYSDAVQAFKRSADAFKDSRINDDLVNCYLEEAKQFLEKLNYEKALQSMESAVLFGGQRLDFILETVKIYKLMQEYKQGIAYLEKFKANDTAEIQQQLISLYYLTNNYMKVQSLASMYMNQFGRDNNTIHYLAWANENLGYYEAALANLRELLATEDSFENNLKIAELLHKAKKPDEAITLLQRMLSRFKGQNLGDAYKLLGDIHYTNSNYSYAEDYYSSAVSQNPGVAEYYYCLARSYEESRKSTEALDNFSQAWGLYKENVQYGFAFAEALKKAGRYTDALAILNQINPFVASDASTTAFHELYADLLTIEQRYDDAYRELQIAVNYAPGNASLQAKLNDAAAAREYYNKNKPEIEIVGYSFQTLYPSLQAYYLTHPIGSAQLFNNTNVPITNVDITVSSPRIANSTFETRIQTLLPNQKYSVDIMLPINSNVYNLSATGSTQVETQLHMRYSILGKGEIEVTKNAPLYILTSTSMDWKNRKQFASFVNPADENIRSFMSNAVLQQFPKSTTSTVNKDIIKAIQVWSFLSANAVGYVSDNTISNSTSSDTDYVQYPSQTLNRKSGDCEDLLALVATMLSTIGVECGFLDLPAHVMLVFNPNMTMDEVLDSGLDPNHFISANNKLWIPLETTQLGKGTFTESWNNAVDFYELKLEEGLFPDLIEFNEAHKLYPPASYSETPQYNKFGNNTDTMSKFNRDLESITLGSMLQQEDEFRRTLNLYPDNSIVANQYALWCISNKQTVTAQKVWNEMLERNPRDVSAMINLGNLYLSMGQYSKARTQYSNALKEGVLTDKLNRNLCILEYKNGDLAKAREYFNKLPDKTELRNLDIKIYSDLLNQGE